MLNIQTKQLKAALYCAAIKDVRYYLNGVLLECTTSGDIHIVATNGSFLFAGLILAKDVRWTGEPQKGPWRMIIPRDAVAAAIKSKAKCLELSAMPDGRYTLGDIVFSPVDGGFPDWRRVIPSSADIDAKPCEAAQLDPALVESANSAVGAWFGWKGGAFKGFLHHRGSDCAVLTGDDMTAFVAIMPMRRNALQSDVRPFTPAPY